MSSRFSGALQLTNLDDFITPSQECIKPIEIKKANKKIGSKVKIDSDKTFLDTNEKDTVNILKKVEITLADCLACSGCITSAESVLVTQQSQEELLKIFKEKNDKKLLGQDSKFIIVSLSIQPVLSLAERFKINPETAFLKLASYFKTLGADMVLDMTIAEDFSLLESAKEFVERYKLSRESSKNQLPMLASSCPGWICYAEKTHGNFILPFISVTKSPQQIMGSMVKYYLSTIKQISPENIYHITVMPCYDKKLEAYREDFYNKLKEIRDVDCVITAIELEQMLSQQEKSLADYAEGIVDNIFRNESSGENSILLGHIGSGSGGYSDFIFNYAAKHLFQLENTTIEYKNLKNPDFKEVTLEKDGEILLRFAVANGFRNIQNLVQKLKRRKCSYDYVEIMACPGGCLNGGAQVRPEDGIQPRELAAKLELDYQNLKKSNPENNSSISYLYKSWLDHENSDKANSFLHTQYHEIEKMNTALAMKW